MPLDMCLLLYLRHTIRNELSVLPLTVDPVKDNGRITPTMDCHDLYGIDRTLYIHYEILRHMSSYEFEPRYMVRLFLARRDFEQTRP